MRCWPAKQALLTRWSEPGSGLLFWLKLWFNLPKQQSKVLALIVLFLLSAMSSNAWCQLGQNLMIDTKALSLGHAVTADPVGVNDVHFNPAGLSTLKGRHFGLSMLNTVLKSEAQFRLSSYSDFWCMDRKECGVSC